MRFHIGTFTTGLVFTAAGVAFVLEALGLWTLQVADLRVIGPVVLVVIGVALLAGGWNRTAGTAD
jgi:hypothetical protein